MANGGNSSSKRIEPILLHDPVHHHEHDDIHVHFDESCIGDDFEEDNTISFHKTADDVVIINLGFLQAKHRYVIELKLPAKLFVHEDLILIPDEKSITNIHCKLVEFHGKENEDDLHYFCAKFEFFAHKEKLLKENLTLVDKVSGEKIKLIFNARVLGRGKGTPMLRNGIHCIKVEDDDESEASDWNDFSKEGL